MASATDHAWAAGIVDGEGCIQYEAFHKGNTGRFRVDVFNTDRRIIDALHTPFGGHIYIARHYAGQNDKPCWTWRLAGYECLPFFLAIEPYLISKKEKALNGIKFIQSKLRAKNRN